MSKMPWDNPSNDALPEPGYYWMLSSELEAPEVVEIRSDQVQLDDKSIKEFKQIWVIGREYGYDAEDFKGAQFVRVSLECR